MNGRDTREWRVHPVHDNRVVAINPGEEPGGGDLIAQCWTPEQAQQIVAEHAMLSAPYADDQHQGGHWLDVLPHRSRWATRTGEATL